MIEDELKPLKILFPKPIVYNNYFKYTEKFLGVLHGDIIRVN
jgi:hypothetical protein